MAGTGERKGEENVIDTELGKSQTREESWSVEGMAGEGSEEQQTRWGGLSGAAHLLHLSHIIFGALKPLFACDFPHGVFDIIEKDHVTLSVSVFLPLFSQKHFMLSKSA